MRARPPTSLAGWIALFAGLSVASVVALTVGEVAKGLTSSLAVLWLFAIIFFVQWVVARRRASTGSHTRGHGPGAPGA